MHNWYFYCPVCKRKELKRNGFALCARRGSITPPRTLKYLCRDCFLGFCEALQIPEEDVAEVFRNIENSWQPPKKEEKHETLQKR